MKMNKMRGAADPLTLGYILTAVFAIFATANTSDSEQNIKAQQEQVAQQALYQQVDVATTTVVPTIYEVVE